MANNYFNSKEVESWILDYQKTIKMHNGTVIWKDKKLEEKITIEVLKVIRAIINQYKYYMFEPREDLEQHALLDSYKNYLMFHPSKGSAFNYFSLISKISLLNFTTRKKRHRMNFDIEEQVYLHAQPISNFELFLEDLEKTLYRINDENYLKKQRERQNQIIAVLIDYLKTHKLFVGKQHMNNYFRNFGIKSNEFRGFIKEINQFNEEIFSNVLTEY